MWNIKQENKENKENLRDLRNLRETTGYSIVM